MDANDFRRPFAGCRRGFAYGQPRLPGGRQNFCRPRGRSGPPGHLQILSAIPFTDVAAGHIDGLDAADDVRAATAALAAADEGDEDARFTVAARKATN